MAQQGLTMGLTRFATATDPKTGLVVVEQSLMNMGTAQAKAAHDASMTDGMERNISIFYDSQSHTFLPSGMKSSTGIPWTGPQHGTPPEPTKSSQSIAADVHSHTNNRRMGGEDFLKGNLGPGHIPVFVGLKSGGVQVYIPRANARPTGNMQGELLEFR
jgi:hypothetical protein